MGWTEQFDLILLSGSRSLYRIKFIACALLVLVFLIDAASTVLCRAAPSIVFEKKLADWSARGLFEGLTNYYDDTVDLFVLYIVRTLALIIMGWMAVRVGTPNLAIVKQGAEDEICPPCPPCSNGAGASGSGASVQPLLINGADAAGGGGSSLVNGAGIAAGSHARDAGNVGPTSSAPKPTTEVVEEHLLSHQRKLAAESLKAYAIGAIFLTSTTAQVYIGIKCISFEGCERVCCSIPSLHHVPPHCCCCCCCCCC